MSQPSISTLIPIPAGDHRSGYSLIYWDTISSKCRSSGVSKCVFPSKICHKGIHKRQRRHGDSSATWRRVICKRVTLTFGRLVFKSMMKFHSFPFRLWATLYFLTNARLSVVAPLPASPPLAPWVITPRTVVGTPRSTCGDQIQINARRTNVLYTKQRMLYCSRASCFSRLAFGIRSTTY